MTTFGLIWAFLVIVSGTLAINNLSTIVKLYGENPAQAATAWLTLNSVETGLGGGGETMVNAIWFLLLSWAALRAWELPRILNYLGVVIGVAGIISVVLASLGLMDVYGLDLIIWPLRKIQPALVLIPVIWYLTYAPIHELSHAAGVVLAGGKVVTYKLIPSFWLGEFAGAWIKASGISHSWQQITMTAFPYLLDIICFVAAIVIFRRSFTKNPFLIGLAFMLLCLRPAMDFTFEPIAFFTGDRNDFYALQQIVGPFAIWTFILISIGLAVYSVSLTLNRLVHFSKH